MNLTFCRVAIATVLCGALAASQAVAVNLVSNNSFETYTSCPTAFSQIALATRGATRRKALPTITTLAHRALSLPTFR